MSTFTGYRYESLCKLCYAKDGDRNLLRPQLEAMEVQNKGTHGKSNRKMQQEFLATYGVTVSLRGLIRHYKNHAQYLKDAKIANQIVVKVKRVESREALQRIIDYGSQMIDNWWNRIEGQPQMPVTGKLLMEALKEEGRRAPRTKFDIEWEMMEKEMIEGRSKEAQEDN